MATVPTVGRYVLMMDGPPGADVCHATAVGFAVLSARVTGAWTNGSLHALEVLWRGKPVVAAERCAFSGRGFYF